MNGLSNMKALCLGLAVFLSLSELSRTQSTITKDTHAPSAREKLTGAWRLVALEEPGADGKLNRMTNRQGMLVYTSDGHMSVQLMLPEAESGVSNDYVRNGYEASFGSYDVNEQAHTVTHHVQGSVTRGLVGKDLPRSFHFDGSYLIVQSTRPDEHWSVTWEHY